MKTFLFYNAFDGYPRGLSEQFPNAFEQFLNDSEQFPNYFEQFPSPWLTKLFEAAMIEIKFYDEIFPIKEEFILLTSNQIHFD